MSPVPHYARTVPFDQLVAEFHAARGDRVVYWREDGPLQLWCYTSKAVYDKAWTPAVIAARGLVIDRDRHTVVATPFPKFFNVGELGQPIPDEPCEIFEKVDGSLIIIFHAGGRWRTATKGSLDSDQAVWAQAWLTETDLGALVPGTTYLAEAIYPANRIIIPYAETRLVMLGAYDAAGIELSSEAVEQVAARLGWRAARRQVFDGVAAAVAHAEQLPESEEGYVIRFAGGLRLKAKGQAYKRLHAIVSRVTPLGLWDAIMARDDLDEMRRVILEEFWGDFDAIRRLLDQQLHGRVDAIAALAEKTAPLSDKELGLQMSTLPGNQARYLFAYRRNQNLMADPKARGALLREIRPVGNVLDGYEPSYALQRVAADE